MPRYPRSGYGYDHGHHYGGGRNAAEGAYDHHAPSNPSYSGYYGAEYEHDTYYTSDNCRAHTDYMSADRPRRAQNPHQARTSGPSHHHAGGRTSGQPPRFTKRVTVESGTEYPHCTQLELDALQAEYPKPEYYRAFPHVISALDAGRALAHAKTPRTPEQVAALARVKDLSSRRDLGRDIVFKAFGDFDLAIFGGALKNRVFMTWEADPNLPMPANTYRVDNEETGASRIVIELNNERLSATSQRLWGIYLHQLVHAFIMIHMTRSQIAQLEETADETSECGYEHARRPNGIFTGMMDYADKTLEGKVRLQDRDLEAVEELRALLKKRDDQRAEEDAQRRREEARRNARRDQRRSGSESARGTFDDEHHGYSYNSFFGERTRGSAGGRRGYGGYGAHTEHGTQDGNGARGGYSDGHGQRHNHGHGYGHGYGHGHSHGYDYRDAGTRGGAHGEHPGADHQGTRADLKVRKETDVDPYKVLGVPRDATLAQIKKAYRDLSKKHHPDKVRPEDREVATKRFQDINHANAILIDEGRRARYDETGHC